MRPIIGPLSCREISLAAEDLGRQEDPGNLPLLCKNLYTPRHAASQYWGTAEVVYFGQNMSYSPTVLKRKLRRSVDVVVPYLPEDVLRLTIPRRNSTVGDPSSNMKAAFAGPILAVEGHRIILAVSCKPHPCPTLV